MAEHSKLKSGQNTLISQTLDFNELFTDISEPTLMGFPEKVIYTVKT